MLQSVSLCNKTSLTHNINEYKTPDMNELKPSRELIALLILNANLSQELPFDILSEIQRAFKAADLFLKESEKGIIT